MSTSYLGPLSTISGGRRLFYVDITNQLNTNEHLVSISPLVSSHVELLITGGTIISSNVFTKDGHTLYSGDAVQFWAVASGNYNLLATVTIPYTTSYGTTDSTVVYLKLVPSI